MRQQQYKNWPRARLERRKDAVVAELASCAKANSPTWRTGPLDKQLAQLNDALAGRN